MSKSERLLFPKNFKYVVYAMLVMCAVLLVETLLGLPIGRLGIVPHSTAHLTGIISAPFVHGNWPHLIGNLLGLTISGYIASRLPRFKRATVFIFLTTGLLVWLFASHANHIGASGIVMGYYGLLLGSAVFHRNVIGILSFVALIVATYYANINFFATLFDFSANTSSASHIFGFISGLAAAYLTKSPLK
ncbi:rhomboid family intramembrane serine protease [Pseudoalteromonas sp. T1lg65]|uniref:rhomboid family intramembrane serine protease n=1 Tax=Pseudoalteromonas sp. T1lg65 TaxID=2077101 RepID=UPI003F7AA002